MTLESVFFIFCYSATFKPVAVLTDWLSLLQSVLVVSLCVFIRLSFYSAIKFYIITDVFYHLSLFQYAARKSAFKQPALILHVQFTPYLVYIAVDSALVFFYIIIALFIAILN